jgi:plasmid replication initiation protein
MENEMLVQSNTITQARYEFTKIEKRIIYRIIKEIRKQYVTGELQSNLFNELVVCLTFKDLQEVSENTQLVYKSIRTLKTRSYEFDNDEEWLILGIINKARHIKTKGTWEITVDREMVAQFVELAKNYTEYSLTVAMSLRSEYSQRLYEYCSQFRSSGGFRMKVQDMKEKMRLVKKYDRYAGFKKYVLDVALKELKELYKQGQCDLYFEYSEEKNGRSVETLRFKIISRETPETKMSLEDLLYSVRNDLTNIFDIQKMPKNKEFVNKTMTELMLNPEKLNHCFGKLAFVKGNLPKEEWQKYMRYIINDEYFRNGE